MLVDGRHHLTAELLLMISYVSALDYVLRYVDDIGGSYTQVVQRETATSTTLRMTDHSRASVHHCTPNYCLKRGQLLISSSFFMDMHRRWYTYSSKKHKRGAEHHYDAPALRARLFDESEVSRLRL